MKQRRWRVDAAERDAKLGEVLTRVAGRADNDSVMVFVGGNAAGLAIERCAPYRLSHKIEFCVARVLMSRIPAGWLPHSSMQAIKPRRYTAASLQTSESVSSKTSAAAATRWGVPAAERRP